MKLRRDIAAVPLRTGAGAWNAVVGLITKTDSIDAGQLTAAASVMAALLSEEHYAKRPLVLKGDGHRLVIYLSYGPDALTQGDAVTPLDWNPTAKDWTLFVPCDPDDIDWAKDALAARAARIKLHKLDETPADLEEETATSKSAAFEIDWSAAG